MSNKKKYLTIHGHFYQPPRENPWLECIEIQESAAPCHDWNERVCKECYSPNSISKIVGGENKILDIVNNYEYMSFNMGPTLLSWLEKYQPYTYSRIIKADENSRNEFCGHGNALAQVYNHIIMPLANERDKYTQVLWGIADFKYRFGRMPEGIWLAETACDDETLGVLADCGIKFTVLSPYQAQSVIENGTTKDVSDGTIDTRKPYIYNIKCREGKSINLFFYNAQISQAVAFEELLKDGGKFAAKLKTGITSDADNTELVNIATDGESYGHHTKFGDMALSYVLRIKSCDEGFTLTNYGEYLDKFPPKDEVVIKNISSWSCFHGVGRWKEDCGCSTGGMQGWNQKWRTPLRNGLDLLRDKLIKITEKEGKKYFKDVWNARNEYIRVILDRNEINVKNFLDKELKGKVSEENRVNALKLMEIQRQAMLMYTSCGWFFNDLSGIETIQILKYAARAIQLAKDFFNENLEKEFLDVLSEARSNIPEVGSGKDIWENFVRPSIIDFNGIATLWAISSLYKNYEKSADLYCYQVTCNNSKKVSKGNLSLLTGHLQIKSKVTLEVKNLMFVLLQDSSSEIHCTVKPYVDYDDYLKTMKSIIKTFKTRPVVETFRLLDEYFGNSYYSLSDILKEDRLNFLKYAIQENIEKLQSVYREIYEEEKSSVLNAKSLGLEVPEEYKLAAKYTLSQDFNIIFSDKNCLENEEAVNNAVEINNEAKLLDIKLSKDECTEFFAHKIAKETRDFTKTLDMKKLDTLLKIFEYRDKLEITPDITIAQNVYFKKIYQKFTVIMSKILSDGNLDKGKESLSKIVKLGDKLNIDTDFYKNTVLKVINTTRT